MNAAPSRREVPASAARPGLPRPPRGPAPSGGRTLLPAPTLELRAHDVDVWRAALDDQPVETMRFMQALLSADEVRRAHAFFFDRDRRRYVIARGILRLLLSRYLDRAPQEIVFRYGSSGKPALAPEFNGAPLFFNVAHSEGLALFAFTRVGEIGVDVEWMRDLPDWEQVAEAAFSAHELEQLRACPPELRRDEFFRAWTRQEAVLKALGSGLTGARQITTEAAFNVYPLDAGPGFAAALAASPAARKPSQVLGWNSAPPGQSGGGIDQSSSQHPVQN
jgi:4'-phosphopantetheinyl transferase